MEQGRISNPNSPEQNGVIGPGVISDDQRKELQLAEEFFDPYIVDLGALEQEPCEEVFDVRLKKLIHESGRRQPNTYPCQALHLSEQSGGS